MDSSITSSGWLAHSTRQMTEGCQSCNSYWTSVSIRWSAVSLCLTGLVKPNFNPRKGYLSSLISRWPVYVMQVSVVTLAGEIGIISFQSNLAHELHRLLVLLQSLVNCYFFKARVLATASSLDKFLLLIFDYWIQQLYWCIIWFPYGFCLFFRIFGWNFDLISSSFFCHCEKRSSPFASFKFLWHEMFLHKYYYFRLPVFQKNGERWVPPLGVGKWRLATNTSWNDKRDDPSPASVLPLKEVTLEHLPGRGFLSFICASISSTPPPCCLQERVNTVWGLGGICWQNRSKFCAEILIIFKVDMYKNKIKWCCQFLKNSKSSTCCTKFFGFATDPWVTGFLNGLFYLATKEKRKDKLLKSRI